MKSFNTQMQFFHDEKQTPTAAGRPTFPVCITGGFAHSDNS
jgi:hypothetical protein